MNFIKLFLEKFKNAFSGLLYGLLTDISIIIQFSIMIIVIIASFILKLTIADFIIVVLLSGLVVMAEFLNSSIELLSDYVTNRKYSLTIKRVKDLAAGAVLIISITALVIGIMIFSKYLF